MEKVNCVFDDKDFGFSQGNTKFQSDEIFKDYKPQKNANKRFNAIAEENAKRVVQDMDRNKQYHAQRMGRLYMTGSDSNLVKHDITQRDQRAAIKKKAKKSYTIASNFPIESQEEKEGSKHSSARIFSPTRSLQHSTRTKFVPPTENHSPVRYNAHTAQGWEAPYRSHSESSTTATMRTASALYHADRIPGGKYNIANTLSPYDDRPFRVSVYVYQSSLWYIF